MSDKSEFSNIDDDVKTSCQYQNEHYSPIMKERKKSKIKSEHDAFQGLPDKKGKSKKKL